jgi:putative membrane protein
MALFSDSERERIASAISDAESRTRGEIVAVVAAESDSYIFIGLTWAAMAALFAPLPLLLATVWPFEYIYIAQLLTFLVLALLVQWRPLRLAIVPGPVKRAYAHRKAMEQFLAQNLHTTRDRTGVLIFVSIAEHYAEVIADEGIYRKAPRDCWNDIVRHLTGHIGSGDATTGFLLAIDACGRLLAEHFPRGRRDSNELPNHLIVL